MTEALLALEDGTWFRGRSVGAEGETVGEVVFNTGMSGYQEVLTDPSYARQIVVMTAPQQGNYGINREDAESDGVRAAGFVVREAARRPTGWRAEASIDEYLRGAGVVGIEEIDTRELTLRIRDAGAMRGAISTVDLDAASLSARARAERPMEGADLAASVSTSSSYAVPAAAGSALGRPLRVAALDWGVKRNTLLLLARHGCDVLVHPARTPAREILAGGYDGVFLSNGPGDPSATRYAIETARGLLGKVPVFGICLGHQILAKALGGSTYKLKFGHRGANQPVIDLESGRVEITSHNHGFAVDPGGWAAVRASGSPPLPAAQPGHGLVNGGDPASPTAAPVVTTPFGRVALTHWNLNDGTLEGMRCLDVPAFSVQYHPEAAPGPNDAAHLFGRFVVLMDGEP